MNGPLRTGVEPRKGLKWGLLAGVAMIFVSAIGMVEAFGVREIAVGISLGYILLFTMPALFARVATNPPVKKEGMAEIRPGPLSLLTGVLVGALAGGLYAVFVGLVGEFDVRRTFTNISPTLIELVSFGRGFSSLLLIYLLSGAALGALGASYHLLPRRISAGVISALLWILTLGLLESAFRQILRGVGLSAFGRVVYRPGEGLTLVSALVLFVALFALHASLRPGRKPLRAKLEALPDKPRRRVTALAIAIVIALTLILPQILGSFLTEVLNVAGIFLIMALGLNIVVGFAGLLDLGYVAFFAVGAYTVGILTSPLSPRFQPELVFWAALPVVVLAAATAGIMVGTPVLRMRGDYLAIVTLGFGEIARLLFLSDALKGTFGGAQGIIRIPDLYIGPLVIRSPQQYFYVILMFVLLAAYVSYSLQDSRMGRAWMALREDEDVAEAMGVNIVSVKLWAFVIGAVLASFGGALFGAKIGSVFPHSFSIIVSITVLVVIIVGGLGSIPGVILGALVLVGMPELLREFEEYKFLVYGALLIFMMLKRPEGFLPSKRRAQELHESEMLQDAWLKRETEEQEESHAQGAQGS